MLQNICFSNSCKINRIFIEYVEYLIYTVNMYNLHSFCLLKVSIDQGRNHLIGHVHIRQLRVQETSCSYPPIIYKYTLPTKTCRYDYSAGQRSNKPFGVNSSWEHGPVGGCVMWGRHGVYDSSGYTLQLNNSRSVSISAFVFCIKLILD